LSISQSLYALTVDPTTIVASVGSGKSETFKFVVGNTKEYPVVVKISKTNWSMTEKRQIVRNVAGKTEWLSLGQDKMNISANSSKKVPFTVTVPQGALGEYRALVFFEEAEKQESKRMLSAVTRIGVSVYISVEGTEMVEGKLEEIQLASSTIIVNFHNSGNVHIRPAIKMLVKDNQGKLVKGRDGEPVEILITTGWPVLAGKNCIFSKTWKNDLAPGNYLAIFSSGFQSPYGSKDKFVQTRELEFKVKNGDILVK